MTSICLGDTVFTEFVFSLSGLMSSSSVSLCIWYVAECLLHARGNHHQHHQGYLWWCMKKPFSNVYKLHTLGTRWQDWRSAGDVYCFLSDTRSMPVETTMITKDTTRDAWRMLARTRLYTNIGVNYTVYQNALMKTCVCMLNECL